MRGRIKQAGTFLVALVLIVTLTSAPVFAAERKFKDVSSSSWYSGYVDNLTKKKIINGYQDGTFRPDNNVERQHVCAMVVRATGMDYSGKAANFPDVVSDSEMSPYIAVLQEKGVINGYQNGNFGPKDSVKRGQAAIIISRAFNLKSAGKVSGWRDTAGHSAEEQIKILASNGIIKGFADGTFKPNAPVTRAQLSKMLTLAQAVVAVQKAEASYDPDDIAQAQSLVIDLPEQKERDALYARIHRLLSAKLPNIYGQDFTSNTPSPELWALIDRAGVTREMIAADKNDGSMSASIWGYPDNVGSKQYDFIMLDFYTSSQPDHTYWALLNWYMDMGEYKRIKGYDFIEDMYGYAGLQSISSDETTAITSIWQSEADNGDILTPSCIYPTGASDPFDHEGSGTMMIMNYEWKANRWYRFVVRSYADKSNTTTYVASYVMDLETGQVTLISVYDTQLPKSFMYNDGQFLENFSEESYFYHRDMYMKNFYARDVHTQKWHSLSAGSLMIGSLGKHQGSYRFSSGNGILRVESCGIGTSTIKNNNYNAATWRYNLSQPKTPNINEALFPIHINK
ncbi:MAG: DUF3472 domain-containing protein [Clostridiaceae bacterium]|nr:DUF3472 domain-containing protein [Clostridiaceae bacterium]